MAPRSERSAGEGYSEAIAGHRGDDLLRLRHRREPEGEAFGAVVSFVTPLPPTVTTTAATAITNSSATINGSGIPSGAATTGWLRFALTSPGTCNDTFGSRVPASGGTALGPGDAAVGFSQAISGLRRGRPTTCAIDSSTEGTRRRGAVVHDASGRR